MARLFLKAIMHTAAVLCSCILLCFSTSANESSIENHILPIQYRNAHELIPILSPLLQPQESVNVYENKLILYSSDNTLNNIKQILQKLDTPSIQLKVTLYHGAQAPNNVSGLYEDNRVTHQTDSMGPYQRTIRSTSRESQRKTETLLIQSGEVGVLNTSITIPLLNTQFAYEDRSSATYANDYNHSSEQVISLPNNLGNQDIVTLHDGAIFEEGQYLGERRANEQWVEYHTLADGLTIRPKFIEQDNQVLLEVLSRKTTLDQPNQLQNNAYNQFEVQTTLMLPLNEWIYLGGNRLDRLESSGYHYRTETHETNKQHLWVFIEKITN